jgi:hypothetical protein
VRRWASANPSWISARLWTVSLKPDDFGQVADDRVELGKLRLGLGLVSQELLTMGDEGLRQALEILLGATLGLRQPKLGLGQAADDFGQVADGRVELRKLRLGLGLVSQELLTMGE